jgi:hypothetical protein
MFCYRGGCVGVWAQKVEGTGTGTDARDERRDAG